MKKVILLYFLFFAINPSFPQALTNNSDKEIKVGVALAGGGALGFAHIGALMVIDSLGIPIDYVAGTSMGGLVGAFVSMGYSPKEIEKIVMNEIKWTNIFDDEPSRYDLPFIEKEVSSKEQLVLKLSNNYAPQLPEGFLEGQNIFLTFLKYTYPFEPVRDFSKLPIPLRVVAVDLVSGDEIVLDKGSLAFAMRSTMSIPTVFSPTNYKDKLLIDGGVINNFPVDVVKKMGADIVIGLNLTAPTKKKEELTNLMSILNRTTDIPRFSVLHKNITLADVYIPQNIQGFTPGDFEPEKIKQLIERGKKAAYENLDKLIALKKQIDNGKGKIDSYNVNGNKLFTSTQIAKMLGFYKGKKFNFQDFDKRYNFYSKYPFIKSLDVDKKLNSQGNYDVNINVAENPNPIVIDFDVFQEGRQQNADDKIYYNIFEDIKNKPLDLQKITDKINYLYSFGYFKTIRYEIYNEGENKIRLIFDVSTDYMKELYASIHYDDYYKLVGLVGLKVNSTLIPGLRWDLLGTFSGITSLRSKISFPSRTLDQIFYPFWEFKIIDREQDLFGEQATVSVAKFFYKDLFNRIGVGITPSKYTNLEVGYNIEWVNLKPSVGFTEGEEVNFHMNDYFAILKIDALDNFNFPQNGVYFRGSIFMSKKKLGSHYDYTQFFLYGDIYKKFGIHGFRLNAYYFDTWGDGEPFPKTTKIIGGARSFIGWEYSSALLNKITVLRGEYHLNFIKTLYLDFYLNTAFYLDFFYENSDTPNVKNVYWGGGIGITYNSIIGPMRFIWALGDNSVLDPTEYIKRFYFTLGVKIGDLLEF